MALCLKLAVALLAAALLACHAAGKNISYGAKPMSRLSRRLQQLPFSASAQIAIHGVIQQANLDPTCADSKEMTCGGTMKVNNQVVTIPKNIVVMLPASAATWQELFTAGITGLALADPPSPKGATYVASVTANRVGDKIIAALVEITQDALVSGAGYISSINYDTGELVVESLTSPDGIGAVLRLNDPAGRYGMVQTEGMDPRFCVDAENPTIRSATGFPMCIPRINPADGIDELCPMANRPMQGNVPAVSFTMTDPRKVKAFPDPYFMAPFMVGDYITYAGVVTANSFFAAYEVVNNVAIYTAPGADPAYVSFEAALIGTGGLNVLGAAEAADRSRWEGFTTDWTRPIQMWGLDFDPATGNYVKRDYGQVMPDPGPAAVNGAVQGRWRFRPPCTMTGPLQQYDPFLGNKGCTPPAAGVYTPPTREVMAEVVGCKPVKGAANGIESGGCTYRNPAIEYIWPENVPGTPIVENNFNAVPFLTKGGYYKPAGGVLVGPLDPWPSNIMPGVVCKPPTILLNPMEVIPGPSAYVDVSADVSGDGAPFSYTWSADVPADGGSCAAPVVEPRNSGTGFVVTSKCGPVTNIAADTPNPSTTYTLLVTNTCNKKFSTKLTVNAVATVPKPAISPIGPQEIGSGIVGVNITARLTDALATVDKFTWSPPAGTVIASQSDASSWSTIKFNAPVIPFGTLTPTPLQFSVVAGSAPPLQSASQTAVVNVLPPPDTITITSVNFKCDKHRLTITATTNLNNPNLVLTLKPYLDNSGAWFDPTGSGSTFTYGLAGGVATYTYVGVAVPLPSTTTASLMVESSVRGKSAKRAVRVVEITNFKGNSPCTI